MNWLAGVSSGSLIKTSATRVAPFRRRSYRKWKLALVGVVLVALATSVPAGAVAWNVLANPRESIAEPLLLRSTGPCFHTSSGGVSCASPCYPKPVIEPNSSRDCTSLGVSAMNLGRAMEHLQRVKLPTNFQSLTVDEQLFVLVNSERLVRGEPPIIGIAPALDAAAENGAQIGRDPILSSSYGSLAVATANGYLTEGSLWGVGEPNAASIVFAWMYDDGWAGSQASTINDTCTSATASGCWGHRDELLGLYTGTTCSTCVMGIGYATRSSTGGSGSFALLVVRPLNGTPKLSFSWKHDVAPKL